MISDTLYDAGREIRRYLRECPREYEGTLPEIAALLLRMGDLRRKLDAGESVTVQHNADRLLQEYLSKTDDELSELTLA